MRLCAIRLANVRRFTSPVEILGIGPGLNVLPAPNEQGKSTIFDALHALFFVKATSSAKEVLSLIPHAGGDPRIEAEIEHDGSRYWIVKQFHRSSGKGEAKIWRGSDLYLQADAAEAWLQQLMKAPRDGGPAGLLWVRQGLTGFEDAKETLDARRDLMTLVAGEIGAVTGGARMDRLRRQLRSELDRYVTRRGARAGGPLALAEAEAEALAARRSELAAQAQDLHQLLDRRRELRAEQADLDCPGETRQRQERLAAAEQAVAAAGRHQERLDQARRQRDMAAAVLENHQRKVSALTAALDERSAAAAALAAARPAAEAAECQLLQAMAALKAAQDEARQARAAAETARGLRDRSVLAGAAAQAAARRRDLLQRLAQARTHAAQIDGSRAAAAAGPDARALAQIEQAREALALARHAREAAAAAVMVSYEPGREGSVLFEGAPLAGDIRLPLPEGGRLEIPGLASLTVFPGQPAGADTVEQAAGALAAALRAAGCGTVEEARAGHKARSAAGTRLKEAQAALALLAPGGIEALQRELDGLPQPPEACEDLPDAAAAEAALTAALKRSAAAELALELARNGAAEARLAAQKSAVEQESAGQRLAQAEAALEPGAETAAAALNGQTAAFEAALAEAARDLAQLGAAAPAAEQAQAALARAKSVFEAARQRSQDIARDLAVTGAKIGAHASQAVEEELAEAEEKCAAAAKRLDAVRFEVAVLQRLEAALERAREAAQDHYVGPVLKEMEPLLRMLWPGAALEVDADQVLPRRLSRGGAGDDFDALSGGTQEQIALLVRLAFARLLARAGRAAPVILDDAIVYTDDSRIEKIFDALTMLAGDLQIIVFSCRQKAFRGLGGTQLAIRAAEAALTDG